MSGNEFEEGPIFVVIDGGEGVEPEEEPLLSDEEIERRSEEAEEGWEPPPGDRTPWTISLEITVDCVGAQHAEDVGQMMLNYIVSGWDGSAGAVMKVEPNA